MFTAKIILPAAILALRLGSPEIPAPVQVQLSLQTEIAEIALQHLRDEVEQIFSPAGICFDWSRVGREALVRVVLEARPQKKVIAGCSRGRHDHRLAVALPTQRMLVLWTEQVARASAGDWDNPGPPKLPDEVLGRALGRVLAHELGHIFLRHRKHRSTGLMKPSFKHRDFSSRDRRSLSLTPEDIGHMRKGVMILLAGNGPESRPNPII